MREARRIVCPVCGAGRTSADTPFETISQSLAAWNGLYYNARYNQQRIAWACERCIRDGRALRADRGQQFYGLGGGVHAYADLERRCPCGGTFTFSAKEQRHWYETLGFFIDSTARTCKPCRKTARQRKAVHARIAELLEGGEPLAYDTLVELADLYAQLGSDKAAIFARRAQKIASREA